MPPSMARLWERSAGWSTLSRLLYLNFKEYLPNDLMVKADRCSMAHGLEVRSPFLDTALIEYMATLPDRFKVHRLQQKVLLKHAFSDLLPSSIRRRAKMGFGVPLGTWCRRQWREPTVNATGDTTVANVCVDRIGEIYWRCPLGQIEDLTDRREDVDLVREQVKFNILDKFERVTCALLQFKQVFHPFPGPFMGAGS